MWISVLLTIIVLTALSVALVRVVRQDGLGHRLPPASHRDWFEQLP